MARKFLNRVSLPLLGPSKFLRKLLGNVTLGLKLDVLIKNGLIVDGSGSPWYHGDVGINEGRFCEIGELRKAEAELE